MTNQEILISIWNLHNLELFQCNEAFLNRTRYSLQNLQQDAQIERFYSRNEQILLTKSYQFSKLLQSLFLRRESEVIQTDTFISTANHELLHIVGIAKVLLNDEQEPTAILTYQRVVAHFDSDLMIDEQEEISMPSIYAQTEEQPYSEDIIEILDDCLPISEHLAATSIGKSELAPGADLNEEETISEDSYKRKNSPSSTTKAKTKERQFKWYRGPKSNTGKFSRNKTPSCSITQDHVTFSDLTQELSPPQQCNTFGTQNPCKDFKIGHKQTNPWSGKTHNPFLEKIHLRQQQQQILQLQQQQQQLYQQPFIKKE